MHSHVNMKVVPSVLDVVAFLSKTLPASHIFLIPVRIIHEAHLDMKVNFKKLSYVFAIHIVLTKKLTCYHVSRLALVYSRMQLYSPTWRRSNRGTVFMSAHRRTVFWNRLLWNSACIYLSPVFYLLQKENKKKIKTLTHTMTMLASPKFTVGMLQDEWWVVPGFPLTQGFSISVKA